METKAGTLIATLAIIERRILELGRKEADLARIEADMQAEIKSVRAAYQDRLKRRAQTIEKLREELRCICEEERPHLLQSDKKSVNTLYGRIGWEKDRDRVRNEEGTDNEQVGQALRDRGLGDLVIEKLSYSRSAVLRALKRGDLDGRTLRAVGLRFEPGEDQWYCKIDQAAVAHYLHGQNSTEDR